MTNEPAMAPLPTGTRESRDGHDWVVYRRVVRASVDAVWSALTDADALARWVGRPEEAAGAQGPGDFHFMFEGDDLLPMTYHLDLVEAGRRLHVSVKEPAQTEAWRLEVELDPAPDDDPRSSRTRRMVLTVAQTMPNAALAPSVAAGWEYYLDRLMALVEGRDVNGLDYDDYFLAQAELYREMFPVPRPRR